MLVLLHELDRNPDTTSTILSCITQSQTYNLVDTTFWGALVTMKIRPLGNRVLVQRSKGQTTKGGILLPDTAQEKPKEGEVLAVGPGKSNDKGQIEPMHVKVGDKILFGSYAGVEVKGMDKEGECLILTEDEILGVLL